MMRRPQRTEAAQRLEARTARTLGLPLVRGLGGELNQWPRAQPVEAACGGSASTGRTAAVCCRSTARELAAARGVRRSNARGVRAPPMPQDSRCTPW